MTIQSIFFRLLILGALLPGAALSAQGAGPLGVASDFDLWGASGLSVSNGSVYGRVSGFKVVELHQFGLGLDTGLQATDDVIISGGELIASFGVVSHGNAVAAHQLSIEPNVMFRASSQLPRIESIYDYEAVRGELKSLAGSLGFLPETGDVTLASGVLFLTGTESGRNVFSVNQSELQAANRLSIDIPSGAVALVNVEGGVWSKTTWGLEILGVDSSSVLINAFESSDISLSNVNFEASILAPRAVLSIDQMHVAGNVVARFISMTNAHTTGVHLAAGPWDPSSAGFNADESGHDAPDYSMVWTTDYPTQNVALAVLAPGQISVVVDGIVTDTIRAERISRLVFDGPASLDHLHIDSALTLPIELSGAAPVAMDDRVELPKSEASIKIEVLHNDLEGPAPFGAGAVQIVSGPNFGTVQVNAVTNEVIYTRPTTSAPFFQARPRFVQFWYVAVDQAENQSTPRRVWITLGRDRGITTR